MHLIFVDCSFLLNGYLYTYLVNLILFEMKGFCVLIGLFTLDPSRTAHR